MEGYNQTEQFQRISEYCKQSLSSGKQCMILPEIWRNNLNLNPETWFVYSLNNSRNLFDLYSAQIARLTIALQPRNIEHPTPIESLEEKIKNSPGACYVVLLLIFGWGNLETLRDYGKYIVNDDANISRAALPLKMKAFSRMFRSEVDAKILHKLQYCFFCPTIEEGEFDVGIDAHIRMPYEEETHLRNGSSASVFSVKIAARHYQRRQSAGPVLETIRLARKDFYIDSKTYQNEVKLYDAFRKSRTNHKNIVTALGSVIWGDGGKLPIRSIYFELAKWNLDDYLRIQDIECEHQTLPRRRRNIQQMIYICDALVWLSNTCVYHPPSGAMKYYQYYHGDLNPSNILVYVTSEDRSGVVFKLSDFGETLQWNLRLQPEKKPRLSISKPLSIHQTSSKPRESTFGAPDTTIGERYDVWSFGCIFLLVIVANIDGYHAIVSLSDKRRSRNRACSGDDSDWFYEVDKQKKNSKVNEEVKIHIADYIEYCNAIGDIMTITYLELIRDEMIRHRPSDRSSAGELRRKMSMSHDEIQTSTSVSIDHERELPDGKKVDAVAISPCGRLESFLCRNLIYVWNTRLSRYMSEPIVLHTSSAEKNSGSKSILLCSGDDKVCKVDWMLGVLQLEVYKLMWSNYRAERSDKVVHRYEMNNAILENATLSADGTYLAVAYRSNNAGSSSRSSGQEPSSFLSIRLFSLAPPATSIYGLSIQTGVSTAASRDSDAGLPLPDTLVESNFNAAMRIEHLAFSKDSRYLYRTSILPRKKVLRGNSLMFESWQSTGVSWQPMKSAKISTNPGWQPLHHDGRILTSMTPLHKEIGFVGSQAANSILLYTTRDGGQVKEGLMSTSGGIMDVLIARDDKRIVVLANSDGHLTILGLLRDKLEECTREQHLLPIERELRSTLKYIPAKGDQACLLEMGPDALILLVSRPVERKSFSINVSKLFTLQD